MRARTAGPLSPEKPATPVPATVAIVPSGATFRTRAASSTRKPPSSARATATGLTRALVAGPPSPPTAGHVEPSPATVEIVPSGHTRRTRS